MRDWIGPERAGRGHCAGAGWDARRCLRGRSRAGRRGAHTAAHAAGIYARLRLGSASVRGRFSVFHVAAPWRIMDWSGFTEKRRWRTRSTMARRWCWSATLSEAERALGSDGKVWRRLVQPAADDWREFAEDSLGPVLRIPHHPLRMARFGLTALQSAQSFARSHFVSPRTRAVFAGLAGHSFLSFDQPLSATIGLMFGITVHAVGWPVPRGGAQAITQRAHRLPEDTGRHGAHFVPHRCGTRSASWRQTARLFSSTLRRGSWLPLPASGWRKATGASWSGSSTGRARSRSTTRFHSRFPGERRSAGAQSPCTWAARLRRSPRPKTRWHDGREAERPFVLVAQPTLFDPTRAPEGKHVLWAYCHVPNGSTFDMTERAKRTELKRRSSALRRDSAIACWRATFRRPRRWKRWMRISSAATSAAAQ